MKGLLKGIALGVASLAALIIVTYAILDADPTTLRPSSLHDMFPETEHMKENSIPAALAQSVHVTAAELSASYGRDPVSADRIYREKGLHVSGTISSIERGIFEHTILHLNAPGASSAVSAFLFDHHIKNSCSLEAGTTVDLTCKGAGMWAGAPLLMDCILLLESKRPAAVQAVK